MEDCVLLKVLDQHSCPSWIGCEFANDLKLLVTDLKGVQKDLREIMCFDSSIRSNVYGGNSCNFVCSVCRISKGNNGERKSYKCNNKYRIIFFLEKIIPANGNTKLKYISSR